METLTQLGLVQPAGLASFEKRTAEKSKIYTYETEDLTLTPAFEKQFKANKKAWKYFELLSASYKKSSIHWVMTAKQTTTQINRLTELIADSEAGTNKWKDNKYKK